MRYVIVSTDYEIFGNGTGDVRQHMIEPAERMARVAERHGAPITLFVEMEETLAYQRYAAALRTHLGYDPYALVRAQVTDLVRRGHDAQLHLHPEWYRATFAAGRWNLDFTKATVDSLFETVAETVDYIAERQAALEEMIQAAGSSQSVVAYRAGAFSAQPGRKLIPALIQNGFRLDSSVVHGYHRQAEHVHLDYRNTPTGRQMWRVSQDVAVEDPGGGLWELPIWAVPGRRLHQATFGRLKAKFSKNVPKEQQSRMIQQLGVKKSPVQLAKFLWQRIPIKFDFDNVAPAKLLRWIREVPAAPSGQPDVVVLIGHTKEHINERAFDELLGGIVRTEGLKVSSFSEIATLLPAGQPRPLASVC